MFLPLLVPVRLHFSVAHVGLAVAHVESATESRTKSSVPPTDSLLVFPTPCLSCKDSLGLPPRSSTACQVRITMVFGGSTQSG